jgi:hypothetical protein
MWSRHLHPSIHVYLLLTSFLKFLSTFFSLADCGQLGIWDFKGVFLLISSAIMNVREAKIRELSAVGRTIFMDIDSNKLE